MRTIHQRQGFQVNCPDEIAYRLGYNHRRAGAEAGLAEPLKETAYGRYPIEVVHEVGPRDWADLQPGTSAP